MHMKNKIFFLPILFLILFTNCSLLKYEVKSYSRPPMSLKLYSNNSFKMFMATSLVVDGKLQRTEAFSGKYQKLNDTLVLIYNKFNLTDTLYSVAWGENIFLMDRFDIITIANHLNNRRNEIDNFKKGWRDIAEKLNQVYGIPNFPSPFDLYLLKDSIFASVINISNDSLEITIDKGTKDGVYWGCQFSDGIEYYSVNKVFADSSVLITSNLFECIDLNVKYGEEIMQQSGIEEIKIRDRKVTKPKYLYIKGSI